MIPLVTSNINSRVLELYSSRRNRTIYPNPSEFDVQFAATNQNQDKVAQDPVCKGEIYYKFGWTPQNVDPINYVSYAQGTFGPDSTIDKPVLLFEYDNQQELSYNYPNFFVGFKIYNIYLGQLVEERTITSYDPSTNTVTLNRPFEIPMDEPDLNGFALFSILPQTWSIYIPTVDNNNNVVKKVPLYYNGYYVIFESPNPNYSNPSNSNIFSRRISYYDYETQIAYFDEALPFNYTGTNLPDFEQTWTLRKSLPQERWTLDKATYYKNTFPDNPVYGPLQGYVVTLPNEASSINNYYKGKYIYVVSNGAQTYSPPLPPQSIIQPISGAFFPIYGLFYIRAYNGETKECSISLVNNKYDNSLNASDIPTYIPVTSINSGSLYAGEGFQSIVDEGGGVYKGIIDPTITPLLTGEYTATLLLNLKRGKTYRITFSVRQSASMDANFSYFLTEGGTYVFYSSDKQPAQYISSPDYTVYTFNMTMSSSIDILGLIMTFKTANLNDAYFEWNLLEVTQFDVINIVDINYDNFAPLDYNGTMVSTQEPVCYQMSVIGLTLPNRALLTGSVIAFYPFVYVQIENATAPSRVSNNVIISNNPPSAKAVFVLSIPQVNSPDQQKFVTLQGGGTQIVKFKPNDNLKFSVYLPDGQPFQTLLPDNLPPYPPDPSLQIQVSFSLIRIN